MKSLYESILDDEDVLISDTKEFANNPLNLLINTLEKGNSQEIKSLIQDGALDGFFKDVLDLDIKLFEVDVYYVGPLKIEFNFGYDYIVGFSYWRGESIFMTLATKTLLTKLATRNNFNKKYKITALEDTTLSKNRRRIIQNLKKIGFEKTYYTDKDHEQYVYKYNKK